MAHKPVISESYAKINLFLHITGKRADGYHNLQTIFQFIDLKDTITFLPNNTLKLTISSNNDICSNIKDNLIYKAAEAIEPFARNYGGLDININKQIPMGAGLGGGSSNAATTLLTLNKLWNCKLSEAELLKIGKKLGADVPIFIHGKTCWADGTGDQFSKIKVPDKFILIVKPSIHASTKTLFNDPSLKKDATPITPNEYNYDKTYNAFELIIRQRHPDLSELLNTYSNKFRLTGTGSCFFLLSNQIEELYKISRNLNKYLDTIVTKTLQFLPVNEHTL
ncbi:4-(cytidine 5'-diphospho)-2-C-methyl-D-erythritol kinase [Francisellaceae bacterium]|nr:4-(cytidine 5'-diphospho)-2-C-methyl-D-erythritol kinase [Francisellaceae bacterium]